MPTHSDEAFEQNAHEVFHYARCENGAELIYRALHPFGDRGEFALHCDQGAGPTVSFGEADGRDHRRAGSREVAAAPCFEDRLLVAEGQRSDWFPFDERWTLYQSVDSDAFGRFFIQFHLFTDLPARYWDGQRLAHTVDLCYVTGRLQVRDDALCEPLRAAHPDRRVAWDDPASPFDGTGRQVFMGDLRLDKPGRADRLVHRSPRRGVEPGAVPRDRSASTSAPPRSPPPPASSRAPYGPSPPSPTRGYTPPTDPPAPATERAADAPQPSPAGRHRRHANAPDPDAEDDPCDHRPPTTTTGPTGPEQARPDQARPEPIGPDPGRVDPNRARPAPNRPMAVGSKRLNPTGSGPDGDSPPGGWRPLGQLCRPWAFHLAAVVLCAVGAAGWTVTGHNRSPGPLVASADAPTLAGEPTPSILAAARAVTDGNRPGPPAGALSVEVPPGQGAPRAVRGPATGPVETGPEPFTPTAAGGGGATAPGPCNRPSRRDHPGPRDRRRGRLDRHPRRRDRRRLGRTRDRGGAAAPRSPDPGLPGGSARSPDHHPTGGPGPRTTTSPTWPTSCLPLPAYLGESFVLMEESRSRHQASVEYPRLILYGPDARILIGVSSHPLRPAAGGRRGGGARRDQWAVALLAVRLHQCLRPRHRHGDVHRLPRVTAAADLGGVPGVDRRLRRSGRAAHRRPIGQPPAAEGRPARPVPPPGLPVRPLDPQQRAAVPADPPVRLRQHLVQLRAECGGGRRPGPPHHRSSALGDGRSPASWRPNGAVSPPTPQSATLCTTCSTSMATTTSSWSRRCSRPWPARATRYDWNQGSTGLDDSVAFRTLDLAGRQDPVLAAIVGADRLFVDLSNAWFEVLGAQRSEFLRSNGIYDIDFRPQNLDGGFVGRVCDHLLSRGRR